MAEYTEIAKLVPQSQSQFETNMNFSGVSQGPAGSDCERLPDGSCRSGQHSAANFV
jgi:hypothetical protein